MQLKIIKTEKNMNPETQKIANLQIPFYNVYKLTYHINGEENHNILFLPYIIHLISGLLHQSVFFILCHNAHMLQSSNECHSSHWTQNVSGTA